MAFREKVPSDALMGPAGAVVEVVTASPAPAGGVLPGCTTSWVLASAIMDSGGVQPVLRRASGNHGNDIVLLDCFDCVECGCDVAALGTQRAVPSAPVPVGGCSTRLVPRELSTRRSTCACAVGSTWVSSAFVHFSCPLAVSRFRRSSDGTSVRREPWDAAAWPDKSSTAAVARLPSRRARCLSRQSASVLVMCFVGRRPPGIEGRTHGPLAPEPLPAGTFSCVRSQNAPATPRRVRQGCCWSVRTADARESCHL